MRLQSILCLFFLLLCPISYAEEQLSFERLANTSEHFPYMDLNEKRVEVRGFYYESPEGKGIISPQPNLKSCCVGKLGQLHQQIILDTPLHLPASQAFTFKGLFVSGPKYNQQGQLLGIYFLRDPQTSGEYQSHVLFKLIPLCALLLWFVFRFTKR